jgi:hypothetical protein
MFAEVSGRIGVERKELKFPASTVLQSFQLTSQSDRTRAHDLVGVSAYLYPEDPATRKVCLGLLIFCCYILILLQA